ncbi:MAG: hypothetical protein H0X37_20855 [Herpetosiphonaceae bacterium]|nr:hypothetical protein [Herpetosiphonaceae bacterium]
MSEMPYSNPNPEEPSWHHDQPPVGDPPHLPEDNPREPETPLHDPIDVPPPPHEPNDPHPMEIPTIGDPLPAPIAPAGDPPAHYPVISA